MLQQFNRLMDYIETHLTEEISGKDISQIVGLSDYHFKRMFSYMAGMSLNEYIKNRKLSVANVDLINGAKVTDIAYKYGYQSVEGFSRAFHEWSGFLPSEVSKNKIQKSFPKGRTNPWGSSPLLDKCKKSRSIRTDSCIMEPRGIEPLTSSLPAMRSPS